METTDPAMKELCRGNPPACLMQPEAAKVTSFLFYDGAMDSEIRRWSTWCAAGVMPILTQHPEIAVGSNTKRPANFRTLFKDQYLCLTKIERRFKMSVRS